jgi:hypothetical protein
MLIFTLMEVVKCWNGFIILAELVYSNQLRVMLMFPSGGDFLDMNKLVDFFQDPRFPTQPTHKYSMVVLEWM